VRGGTSRVTTVPAPITASSPIVTPCSTIAEAPIHTPGPIRIGAAVMPLRRSAGATGCPELIRLTSGPSITRSPISIPPMSLNRHPWLTKTSRPIRRLIPWSEYTGGIR
jgi:hypothetical protein